MYLGLDYNTPIGFQNQLYNTKLQIQSYLGCDSGYGSILVDHVNEAIENSIFDMFFLLSWYWQSQRSLILERLSPLSDMKNRETLKSI